MRCGLEVEFHIYRLKDPLHGADLDPNRAAWPGVSVQIRTRTVAPCPPLLP
eukprot:gene36948-biopygen24346